MLACIITSQFGAQLRIIQQLYIVTLMQAGIHYKVSLLNCSGDTVGGFIQSPARVCLQLYQWTKDISVLISILVTVCCEVGGRERGRERGERGRETKREGGATHYAVHQLYVVLTASIVMHSVYLNILHHTAPQYTTVHHTAPQYTTVHHTAPQYTTVHHTAPQYTTVHHTAPQYTTVILHPVPYTSS